jgi:hypothetical protein
MTCVDVRDVRCTIMPAVLQISKVLHLVCARTGKQVSKN